MTELLNTKIELLQEQIDNLERSGFFTELEMDKATVSLRAQIQFYKAMLNAIKPDSSQITTVLPKLPFSFADVLPKDGWLTQEQINEIFDPAKMV